jgi:serine/threonine-protein kinase HipA
MNDSCTIQLFVDGRWHDVADVSLFADAAKGWRAETYTGYADAWVLDHQGKSDAHAMGSQFPVSLIPFKRPHWPVFLFDMLPQGYGRGELLRQLGLPETMTEAAEWQLLLAGAGNPIGHLRIKEAAQWLAGQTSLVRGFSDDEVAWRSDNFIEYLSTHGLFVAGSSGVQGEWPKILLTRARDGLLYLDHTVPDNEAVEHFIVKFGRGSNERLAQILAHEAAYMAIARHLGLRVFAPLSLRERALFIPRFDRRVTDAGVIRLAQESVAAMLEKAGFDATPSHDEAVSRLMLVVTDPGREVLEYLRRDVANLAFGNKDNHARNTALQRDFHGNIALTPVFDFAPMYLHPDGIARRMRWTGNDGSAPDWARVLDRVVAISAEQGRTPGLPLSRPALVAGLLALVAPLEEIARDGVQFGLSAEVHAFLKPHIEAQIRALTKLA